jgi:hypothetical protein
MEDEKERLAIDLDSTPVVEEEDCDEVSWTVLTCCAVETEDYRVIFLFITIDIRCFLPSLSINKELDVSESGTLTWLVKIPKFLSERWQQQAQMSGGRTELGAMRVYDELSLCSFLVLFFSSSHHELQMMY